PVPSGARRSGEVDYRIVGTSGAVWPAAGLAVTARRSGAFVAIVNVSASEIDDEAQLVLRATAAQALPKLLDT
ncbi:MAG TPA: NAD-dependent deacylase, partial [Burkholderiaceae bacterium]|nr:NAD-dependent deacylase [Burkholderiaceae bacterium]